MDGLPCLICSKKMQFQKHTKPQDTRKIQLVFPQPIFAARNKDSGGNASITTTSKRIIVLFV